MTAPPSRPAPTSDPPVTEACEAPEPLRARRRRELREQISSVATRMFLEQGFDVVRVADVARACGVTEKTVYNHFTTKESLLADRWEAMIAEAEVVFADPGTGPLDAAVDVLDRELAVLLAPPWAPTLGSHLADMKRYSELMTTTPSLRTYEREQTGALALVAFSALAVRARAAGGTGGDETDDAERWITAKAIGGLWSVFHRSLHRAVQAQHEDDPAALRAAVEGDVHRAADLLRRGL